MISDTGLRDAAWLASDQLHPQTAKIAQDGRNLGLPTPDEVWNELLLELKAASQELYVAFVSLSAPPQGNEPTTAMPATQRYDEALRRFDAARAKVRALGAEMRKSKV